MHNRKARKRWHVIADLIKDIPEPVGVEVGVLTGRNLFYLLNNVPDLTMVGVDPYVPFDGGDTNSKYSKKILDDMYSSVKQKAEKHNCSILRMSSEVAVDYFKDNSIDFVFLDGNHKYDYVVQDINNWLPKIRKGGYLIGHDWQHHTLGDEVERAVCSVLPRDKVKLDDNQVWYYEVSSE